MSKTSFQLSSRKGSLGMNSFSLSIISSSINVLTYARNQNLKFISWETVLLKGYWKGSDQILILITIISYYWEGLNVYPLETLD